jgi:hypothetical protein
MSQKGSAKTIILIAVVIIGGGIMFYLGIQYQDTENSNSDNSAAVNALEENPVEYTNEEANFKLKLPKGWSVEEDSADYVSFMDPVSQQQEIVTELLQGMKMEVWISSISGVTLEQAVSAELDNYADDEIIEKKDISVDGQEAVKVKMYVLGYSITSYIIYNDNFYKVVGYVGNEQEDSKYVALYSKILSDFEFLD